MEDLHTGHVHVQLGLVHEVGDGEARCECLSVLAVDEDGGLAVGDELVDHAVDFVEVDADAHLCGERDVVIIVVLLPGRYDLVLVVGRQVE